MSSPTPKPEVRPYAEPDAEPNAEPNVQPDLQPDLEPDLEPEPKGPSLVLLYGFLLLGLLAAMTFGAMIVWPFYLRR